MLRLVLEYEPYPQIGTGRVLVITSRGKGQIVRLCNYCTPNRHTFPTPRPKPDKGINRFSLLLGFNQTVANHSPTCWGKAAE